MKQILLVVLTFLLLSPHNALAVQQNRSVATDHRIRTYVYDPNEVFKFIGHYKYQSSIELAPDENIATVSLGDSVPWQVTPSGNRIFLKPVEQDATTNMTIVTNKRIYHFELHAEEADDIADEDMVFSARFVYPEGGGTTSAVRRFNTEDDLPDIEDEPEKFNFNYTISGARNVAPLRIFDDGEFTYFEFKDINAEIPAFFMVDSEGREAVVNYRMTGPYVVVERVTSQFTLRSGPDVVCVFNESMPLQRAEPETDRKFLGLF